ncbi:hypothetical protein GCM10017600_02900 [Streptosporangium carneum]|uniref:Uncharacterized protein n=1 Tax=Streptosporangium carneum TaxID=47481 RepID=A0A9W6HV43_9ACTN|nr:hypothetical protein GCM10017600_02900 [Streptosporangium carneum]
METGRLAAGEAAAPEGTALEGTALEGTALEGTALEGTEPGGQPPAGRGVRVVDGRASDGVTGAVAVLQAAAVNPTRRKDANLPETVGIIWRR